MKLNNSQKYWDNISDLYHKKSNISVDDFHYGPLIPGEDVLNLLPRNLAGMRALEIGCGGAQNSIYLSNHGVDCTAFDISEKQISYAKKFAKQANVEIDLIRTSMDEPVGIEGLFDLIHSVYAISFSENPESVIKYVSNHLKKDGTFIFSTGHPLAQGEWLELEGENGVFIPNYFNLSSDIRYNDDGDEEVRSTYHTLSTISDWIYNSGMVIERILEPQIDMDQLKNAPYYSEDWKSLSDMFFAVPVVAIFICRRL